MHPDCLGVDPDEDSLALELLFLIMHEQQDRPEVLFTKDDLAELLEVKPKQANAVALRLEALGFIEINGPSSPVVGYSVVPLAQQLNVSWGDFVAT